MSFEEVKIVLRGVTYADPNNRRRVYICGKCEEAMLAERVWPHNDHGVECCNVERGLSGIPFCHRCEDIRRGTNRINVY